MEKGQVTGIFLMLAIGLISLVVLADFTDGFCNCLDGTALTNASVPVDVWVNNTCDGEKCDTEYSLTCDGVQLEVGDEYDILDCDYMVTNATYDGTSCTLEYTYEGDYYNDGLVGMLVCYLPVLVALGLLVLAGGWFMLR